MNFKSFPEGKTNQLAATHGLSVPIRFHFDSPDLTGYAWIAWLFRLAMAITFKPKGAYNHRTKRIFLAPKLFQPGKRLDFYTAHEVGHAVTLQKWPLLLHDLTYWPIILGVPLTVSIMFSWWWFLPVMIVTYLIHPFELMANAYAVRHRQEFAVVLSTVGLV